MTASRLVALQAIYSRLCVARVSKGIGSGRNDKAYDVRVSAWLYSSQLDQP